MPKSSQWWGARTLALFLSLLGALRCTHDPSHPRASSFEENETHAIRSPRALYDRPNGAKRRIALVQLRQMQHDFLDEQSPAWRSLGPLPARSGTRSWKTVTGRTRAVAVSPVDHSLILVGSSESGIFRSVDGGRSFQFVTDGLPDRAPGDIAFAPSDPSIVYASMGGDQPESGFLRSTDSGATWSERSGTGLPLDHYTLGLVVDPTNPQRLYLALSGHGLWRSDDGGDSWTRLYDYVEEINSHTSPFALYITTRTDSGAPLVSRSLDDGLSWQEVFNQQRPASSEILFAVAPSAPSQFYVLEQNGTDRTIYSSSDAGAHWNQAAVPSLANVGGIFYLRVDPSDPARLFFSSTELYESGDGGRSWKPDRTLHVDQNDIDFFPSTGEVFAANDGGIYRRVGKEEFQSLNASLALTQIYGMAASPIDPAVLYVGTQDNGMLRSGVGRLWDGVVGGDDGAPLFDLNDPHRYLINLPGFTYRCREVGNDTGCVSVGLTSFYEERAAFIPPLVGSAIDGEVYRTTYRLWSSRDFGEHWTAHDTDLTKGSRDTVISLALSPRTAGQIISGSDLGRVMLSRDDGSTWSDITRNLPARSAQAVAFAPWSDDVLFAAYSGYGEGHLFRSDDAGATWHRIDATLPDTPILSLLIESQTTIDAGTDIGVFRTTDGGVTWKPLGRGFPTVSVTAMLLGPNGSLRAATYGRGVYELTTKRKHGRPVQP